MEISTGAALLVLCDAGGGHLKSFCDASVVVFEGDDGRELLRGIEEGVGGASDTGGVVAFGVGEGTPCKKRTKKGRRRIERGSMQGRENVRMR